MWRWGLLATAGLLGPFVCAFAFALDIYVPAVPKILTLFHTSQSNVQLTLSLFIMTNGLGQLIMGPLSDRFGRRPMLTASTLIFILGCGLAVIANNIDFLIITRVIQALGACGMIVVAFAIVRDVFDTSMSPRVFSLLNSTIAISPMFAPIIGGYLTVWFGWQAGFVFLVGLGLVALLFNALFIQETLPLDHRKSFDTRVFKRYAQVVSNPQFLAYAFGSGSGVAAFFTFFSSSPYIIITLLKQPTQDFGYYFAVLGIVYVIGSIVGERLSRRYHIRTVATLGASLVCLGGIWMSVWYLSEGLSMAGFLWPMSFIGVGGALMMGMGAAGALEHFKPIAGTASAALGCTQFFLASVVGTVAMHWKIESTLPLAISTIVVGGLSFCFYTLLKKKAEAS